MDLLDFVGLLVLFEIVVVNLDLFGRPLSLLFGYTLQTDGSVFTGQQIVRIIAVEADGRTRTIAEEIEIVGVIAIICKSIDRRSFHLSCFIVLRKSVGRQLEAVRDEVGLGERVLWRRASSRVLFFYMQLHRIVQKFCASAAMERAIIFDGVNSIRRIVDDDFTMNAVDLLQQILVCELAKNGHHECRT